MDPRILELIDDEMMDRFKKKFPISGQGEGRSALIGPDGHFVRIHSYEHSDTCQSFKVGSCDEFRRGGGMRVSCGSYYICVDVHSLFTKAMYMSLCNLMRGENYERLDVSVNGDYEDMEVPGGVKPHHIKTELLKLIEKYNRNMLTDIKEHVEA
jgi:hypothetical protein